MSNKVQLYKIRDFGAKINATIEYIRYNILSLLKIVLLIVAPLGLLMAIIFSGFFSTMMQVSLNPQMTPVDSAEFVGQMGYSYMMMTLLSMITFSFLFSAIYGYMLLNDKQEVQPTVMEVLKAIISKVPKMIVLMILIAIVSSIGFIFFVIPGIYLMVTLSLALPILVIEDVSIGKAFTKSFQLIKGKWWSTFGLMVISTIIASVVSYVFAIPFYAFFLGDLFSSSMEAGGDPSAVIESFSSWYSTAGMALMMVGSYITYLIPILALGFQYFNLSERIEGRGIRNQINEFETVA
jgi:hypothetical protein